MKKNKTRVWEYIKCPFCRAWTLTEAIASVDIDIDGRALHDTMRYNPIDGSKCERCGKILPYDVFDVLERKKPVY
jgi:hypothetical protein